MIYKDQKLQKSLCWSLWAYAAGKLLETIVVAALSTREVQLNQDWLWKGNCLFQVA